MCEFCILQVAFFSLKFTGIVVDSIISSHLIAESFIAFAKYFPFSQQHIKEFQI